MGVVFSAIARIFGAIGRALSGLVSVIAGCIESIIGAITSIFVGIFGFLGDFFCCRCCTGRRRMGGRTRRAKGGAL